MPPVDDKAQLHPPVSAGATRESTECADDRLRSLVEPLRDWLADQRYDAEEHKHAPYVIGWIHAINHVIAELPRVTAVLEDEWRVTLKDRLVGDGSVHVMKLREGRGAK